jgi:single-strand DNA-binding protein
MSDNANFQDRNEVHLCGELARDAECRYTTTGKAVAKLTLCTKIKLSTAYHGLVVWEDLAERVAKLKKGARIKCAGRLQTSSWEKNCVKHYKTEVICWQIVVQGQENEVTSTSGTQIGDDDIPF